MPPPEACAIHASRVEVIDGSLRQVRVTSPQLIVMQRLRAAMEDSARDLGIHVSIDHVPFHFHPEDQSSILAAGWKKARYLSDSNLLLTCSPSEEMIAYIVGLVRENPAMHAVLASLPEELQALINSIPALEDPAGNEPPVSRIVGIPREDQTHEHLRLVFRRMLFSFRVHAA